jgi:hypothetical protein
MDQKYKNRKYEVTIDWPTDPTGVVPAGQENGGSVNIVNVPFILTRISHGIMGENHLDAAAAFPDTILQDGQYLLEWRTDQHNYQSAPILANAYGTDCHRFELETPEELAPKTTITVKATTILQRLDRTRLQIVFHGLEPIGEAKPS